MSIKIVKKKKDKSIIVKWRKHCALRRLAKNCNIHLHTAKGEGCKTCGHNFKYLKLNKLTLKASLQT